MAKLSRQAIIGYPAGIITGVTYGLNPLFAMPLIAAGASIGSILFFRYSFAVVILGLFLILSRQSFKVSWEQAGILLVLGLLYTSSSLLLFEAYNYIASGLATTLVFLYPVLVAIIMVFLGVVPSWPVWISIAATFGGVIIMTHSDSSQAMDPKGIILSVCSALVYAMFIVIINRSKTIKEIPNTLLTFYTLTVGAILFITWVSIKGVPLTECIDGIGAWSKLVCLALLPTIVSTATLAVATRTIGATKASVMGVFEPITAILVGSIAFGEPLTANIIIGIVLSTAAVIFMILLTTR
ncbi:MAG: DMT family transporter [Candidatus Egerieousia sp.]